MLQSATADPTPRINGSALEEGEMARRIRELDWAQTKLGPMEEWSPALRMMVTFLLPNRFPQLLWWGPDFVGIYNDAYRPVLGAKHPWALGQPGSVCWQEIWHILKPLIETPFRGGPATWMEDIELELRRHGYPEETHFTIAYSAVPDETAPGGIGGVLAHAHEITDKVIGERRTLALRDLAMMGQEAKDAEAACANAAQALAPHTRDVPFALMYLLNGDRSEAQRAGSAGAEAGHPICPETVRLDDPDAPWPFAAVLAAEEITVVGKLDRKFARVPDGPWSDAPDTAVVVPIPSNRAHQPAGFLVVGVSARIPFDGKYRDFVQLMSAQIGTAIAKARAFAEEAQRAAALAELDRAKVEFFSNVSHEFRTPLTLMLGPLEQALRESPVSREPLEIAHRNSLRLLKLVNSLLDFSRSEAGRLEAAYEPTDLAACTAELASHFRAAMEKAGLRLVVECPPLPEPAYVDRDLWEKIVFNLLSNALKFTFAGTVTVRLRPAPDAAGRRGVALAVEDTGTGIPANEVSRIFERFHRVRNARARSHEGTGIGLALVQELARLHGGRAEVTSTAGAGSVFTVWIPQGAEHLPADRVGPGRGARASGPAHATGSGPAAAPFVEEALRWRPDEPEAEAPEREAGDRPPGAGRAAAGARIVLADDNSDMRDYVRRLLVARGYEVATAADGRAALELVQSRPPALVLTDVMMPGLDGHGLLQALRAEAATKTIPVILLTARAGEEARIEGAAAGADDYLTKPFSARELLARIETHLELARVRRESGALLEAQRQHLRAVVDNSPDAVTLLLHDGTVLDINASGLAMLAEEQRDMVVGTSLHPRIAAEDQERFRAFNAKICGGEKGTLEFDLIDQRGARRHLATRAAPLETAAWGTVHLGLTRDVTADVTARRQAAAEQARVERRLEQTVADRTARLRETIGDLEAFSYSIAHDLRAPLRALRGFAEVLLTEHADGLGDEGRRLLRRIATAGGRMDRLVQDVLNYSRVMRSEAPLEQIDLIGLLREIVAVYPSFTPDKVSIEFDTTRPQVRGNEAMLTQVFSNLLGNAVKFVAPGVKPRVHIATETRPGGRVRVAVRDNGIGIDPRQHERIFEIFQQGEEGFDGTGIGLAIVKKAVERMGGTLGVNSAVGRGSEFWVELAQADDA